MMHYDVVIVGAGLAGVTVALSLPPQLRIALLAKDQLDLCASDRAQGGIAAVLSADDSLAQHVQDTRVAGAGLCDEAVVQHIVAQGPASLDWLCSQGVAFSRDAQQRLHLTREGGHSQRRIVHAGDASGHAIMKALHAQLRQRPNVIIHEHMLAIDLCAAPDADAGIAGLLAFDQKHFCQKAFVSPHVVLATGGLGHLYSKTSNPACATADGIGIASRAGAAMRHLEFIQFHPTCLALPGAPAFLISEALRGEGAFLRRPDGTRFMPAHDARAELAPRDIVARAIAHEMQTHGLDHVLLDITHRDAAFIEAHFPMILQRCLDYGVDVRRDGIPVAPAAHYSCGGVATDTVGRSSVPGLYALGETACTGLHGANRLASNSLLECVATGRALANHLAKSARSVTAPKSTDAAAAAEVRAQIDAQAVRMQLQTLMDTAAGLLRHGSTLERAGRQIRQWQDQLGLPARWADSLRERLELRNMLDAAALIVDAALLRRESCGLHQRIDGT
ncbi:L-aspartate oxidase [Allopusillimonas ginsengisoli]|uniref:L-aspartate oxidase n=1 Tax=Allopusillimonas ginsengisoli TaxID=453575 RepID=UPI00101FCA06|nr:L-aspartate oxidase [Allopusillimonas ginsengisoli]TEA70020.1 L-aspartate oxidase [Allopusillimonas ginsengisoli]